ncbi:glycosyltransferase family 2 protein [candidate division KSB1 bacterium]|nr:glycosyltransferase family 2 protein [candidate division KSB1 bacterium]
MKTDQMEKPVSDQAIKPTISVIIASYEPRLPLLKACLISLQQQRTWIPFEIIVVDSSSEFYIGPVVERFPQIRVKHLTKRAYCGDARNTGLTLARGEIIAFLDSDCTAAPDWIEQIVRAHHSPQIAIGGAIANANPESYVGWAAYFCEFSLWMPGFPARYLKDIAGANMSYKKEMLLRYAPMLSNTYCSDTEMHWRMHRDGHPLLFLPDILIYHHNITHAGNFLRHEYHHGFCFGRVRFHGENFTQLLRLLYLSTIFLLPIWRIIKVTYLQIRNPVYLPRFLMVSPLLFIGLVCWCSGEAAGMIVARRTIKHPKTCIST